MNHKMIAGLRHCDRPGRQSDRVCKQDVSKIILEFGIELYHDIFMTEIEAFTISTIRFIQ